MKTKEDKISKYLAAAFNEFSKLKPSHPSHIQDFIDGIHKCQMVIGWRELQKLNPKKYPTYE